MSHWTSSACLAVVERLRAAGWEERRDGWHDSKMGGDPVSLGTAIEVQDARDFFDRFDPTGKIKRPWQL